MRTADIHADDKGLDEGDICLLPSAVEGKVLAKGSGDAWEPIDPLCTIIAVSTAGKAAILDAIISDATRFAGASIADILADVTGIAGAAMRGTDNAALASVCTETRLSRLNADISSRSSHSAINVRQSVCLTGDPASSIGKILFDLNAWWKNGGRLDLLLDDVVAQTEERVLGKLQTKVISVTSAANAGADTTLATVTAQGVEIDYIIVHADAAQTADMTSAAVKGGAAKVLTFIASADLLQADVDAENKQVAWNTGKVYLPVGGTIVMKHTGTNTGALDLTVIIGYHSVVDGGYLA